MKILVDTQIFLWSFLEPHRISENVRRLLLLEEMYFSAASAWEIAIKTAQGKLQLPDTPDKYVASKIKQADFISLPILQSHALQTFYLPLYHKDPFDRLLVAQAIVEGLTLLTADPLLSLYPVNIINAEKYQIAEE